MSFGLSRGRTLDTSGFGFDVSDLKPSEDESFDPRSMFTSPDRPFELEVGSGKGTFLVQQASLQPARNFLGIEWSGEFFRYAADRARRHGLDGVRLLRADASEFLRFSCAANVAEVIHLYFTDPWPKKKHHKRRFIQDATMRSMHRVLRPGGLVHLVTDHDELWEWYQNHAARHTDLYDRTTFSPPDSAGDGEVVGTNFERKYQREGRPFHAMTLRRLDAVEDSDAS
ncbi:MAG: tRNA (guanosine(46)-N7)-methyltransferase TrmB [Phycisphaerales bacterium]|jgi:tRNA (guanine-N7-)-methyltransferase|nr:tRNA (guanosine(46)-N7)-methyltransferase TrmB [Phycisphaerales bacterium]